MEDLKERYKRACIKKKLDPLDSVLNACESCIGVLNLTGNCLSLDACKVLSRSLVGGHPFHEINLTDCLIGDEGIAKLMNFLGQDSQIVCLNLKGNSIKSRGAIALANALKRNVTLEKLSLEWNNVGVQEEDMKQLSEALTIHPSLRCLDLRSNHIDHTGAGHLAGALELSSSLQELDLRWNNVGVIGGRKLLAALKGNTSLVMLRLEGNSIPADVTEAISASISLRLTQHVMEAQHYAESKELSEQISQLHSDAQQKVIEVLETLDSERSAFLENTQISRCEIEDLKVHLEERDIAIARLETTLLEVKDSLRNSLAKGEGFEVDLARCKKQTLVHETCYKEKLGSLEKEIDALNDKLVSTSSRAKVREKEDEAKLHSLELEVKVLQEKMAASQRHYDSIQQELTATVAELKATISSQQERHKEEIDKMLKSQKIQTNELTDEKTTKEAVLNKRIRQYEEDKSQLEEEVRVLKRKLASEKGKTSEEVDKLQQSLKLQTMKTGHLHDQVKEITTRYEGTTEELHSTISKHKSEKTKLENEISSMQQLMKEKLLGYDSDRLDWNRRKKAQKDQLQDLEEDKEALQKEVKQLKNHLEKEKRKRLESEKEKEQEVSGLMKKLEQQEQVIHHFQLEEKQRMSELRAALDNYLNRPPIK